MRKYVGELGLILTAIIWGSGFAATAIAIEYYSPYQTMFVRFLVGALILCIIFPKQLLKMNTTVLINGLILGTILYLAFALQTVGLQFTTPSKNAFLTAVNVVIVPLLGFLIYKKRLNRFEVIGSVLAITGVGTMSLQLTGVINIGDLLTLFCAFAFALHIIYTATYVKDEDPILLTLIQLLTAAVIGMVVLLLKSEMAMPLSGQALLPVIYLGIFSTTIAYLLQTIAQKNVAETKAAIILSTEAFWGMLFSVVLLGELITLRMAIGAGLILLAIFVTETKLSFITRRQLRSRI